MARGCASEGRKFSRGGSESVVLDGLNRPSTLHLLKEWGVPESGFQVVVCSSREEGERGPDFQRTRRAPGDVPLREEGHKTTRRAFTGHLFLKIGKCNSVPLHF
jgi:hypothetical protein